MVMAAMSSMAFAYDFPVDANGNCVIKKEYPTSKSETDAYLAVKSWMNSQNFNQMNANSDIPNKSLSYNVTLNTKSSYNPFAGQFVENLIFISPTRKKAAMRLSRLKIFRFKKSMVVLV